MRSETGGCLVSLRESGWGNSEGCSWLIRWGLLILNIEELRQYPRGMGINKCFYSRKEYGVLKTPALINKSWDWKACNQKD